MGRFNGTDYQSLNITIDIASIECSLPGNFRDRGLDLSIFFVAPLSRAAGALIDSARSVFEVQQGISHQGHVVSGSIVPRCRSDINADGIVNSADLLEFLTAFFNGDPVSDFDGDGASNSQDFFAFIEEFFAGC